ncbi:MAG: beta-lactamase family protein [Firmicutes bacterium]|nr:beta-lactamase family protein [Bacillota bacterium]
MNKNIEEFNKLLNNHFTKSKHSKLSIGISTLDSSYVYHLSPDLDSSQSFGLGSVSKTFISTYICELINNKKIDLNLRISDYLSLNPKINYPRIRDLLTHTSGYHAFIPLLSSMSVLLLNGFNKKNIYKNTSRAWLLKSLKKIKPMKTKYRYSDYNYAVVALIIEHIEQRPFKDVMIDYIHNKLGMHNTYYGSYLSTKKDLYSWLWEDENPFLPSGGLFSNIDDMQIFLNYQIKQQKHLADAHHRYSKTNLNKSVYTGFSWNSFINGCFYWHIGGQGYYRSYVLFDTKKQISLVILATVDVNVQHVNRLGSSLYRCIKRNNKILFSFLEEYSKQILNQNELLVSMYD